MAKTEYYYFQGKASWAKLVTPDHMFKKWSVKLHLTPESYALFMKLKEKDGETEGILNEVKKDDDGYFVNLSRPTEKRYRDELRAFTPPEVIDKDGKVFQELIGDGSDITCKVECYRFKLPFKKNQGRAIRLASVRVDNLVPFTRAQYTDEQEALVKGLDEQPKQLF